MLLRLHDGGLRPHIATITILVALIAAQIAPRAQTNAALKARIDDVKNKLNQDVLRDRSVDELLAVENRAEPVEVMNEETNHKRKADGGSSSILMWGE